MNSVSVLMLCVALVPALFAARVWLLVAGADDDLRGYRHFANFDD